MQVDFLADCDWKSRVDKIVRILNEDGPMSFFNDQDFGGGVRRVSFIYVCRDVVEPFRARKKYIKSRGELLLDVNLDYEEFLSADDQCRLKAMLSRSIESLPDKLLPEGFQKNQFLQALELLFKGAAGLLV